jgi:rhodanese-related sulfurtransferase
MNDFIHKLPVFLHQHLALAALFAALLLAIIGVQLALLLRKYKELTPASLTLLINRHNPLLIDLSAHTDYEQGHVPGARHMTMSQFDPQHKDLIKAKELPIVVMDKDGRGMASKAAQQLIKAGFAKVHILGGGVHAWREAQLPLSKGRH